MSSFYNMHIKISGHVVGMTKAIKTAANSEWEFDDWFEYDGKLSAGADGNLCGGETEKQFAERVSVAVWKANEKFCNVEINATYLQELPYETYSLDEDDFERLKAEVEKHDQCIGETAGLQKLGPL